MLSGSLADLFIKVSNEILLSINFEEKRKKKEKRKNELIRDKNLIKFDSTFNITTKKIEIKQNKIINKK